MLGRHRADSALILGEAEYGGAAVQDFARRGFLVVRREFVLRTCKPRFGEAQDG
jgi:hypothetical protein